MGTPSAQVETHPGSKARARHPCCHAGSLGQPVTFFSRTLGVVELQFMLWGPIALFGLCIAAASWYFFRDFR